jgi:SAM-dependent methyltransferase
VSDIFSQALGSLAGGLVLDVATGEGGFAGLLAARLQSYKRIVGIDTSAPALPAAQGDPDLKEHCFARIDAEVMAFRNAAFDTAAVSASLHHLEHPARVLAEMVRVLKPGGRLIIAEMHASARTEPQRTAVQIHHWAAAVDTALGVAHFPTFPRQQFVEWTETLPLDDVEIHDRCDTNSDPFDPQFAAQVKGYIDNYLERAREADDYPLHEQQAAALWQRLNTIFPGGASENPACRPGQGGSHIPLSKHPLRLLPQHLVRRAARGLYHRHHRRAPGLAGALRPWIAEPRLA